jgi:hypothetical protein
MTVGRLLVFMVPLLALVDIVYFWQAIAEVQLFARTVGSKVASIIARAPRLLFALLAIKIAWVAAGYFGALGADWTMREGSAGDGPLAWCVAAVFAAASVRWLARAHKVQWVPGKSALILTAGFLLPSILNFGLFLAAVVVSGAVESTVLVRLLLDASGRTSEIAVLWGIPFAALLLPIGVGLQGLVRFRYLSTLATLTGLWTLPWVVRYLFPNLDPVFEYRTFDVTVTFMLLVLAGRAWRAGRLAADAWMLALVLGVSTLVALTGSLVPAGQRNLAFYLLLVFPFVYQLLSGFPKGEAAGSAPESVVIQRVGLQTALMLLVAWGVVTRFISPGRATWSTVANLVFLPPFLALYLAATTARHAHAPSEEHSEPSFAGG